MASIEEAKQTILKAIPEAAGSDGLLELVNAYKGLLDAEYLQLHIDRDRKNALDASLLGDAGEA